LFATQAITEALDVARENHDEDCLSQALSWLTFIESKHNAGVKQKFVFGEDKAKNKNIAYLKSMDLLWDIKRKLQRVCCITSLGIMMKPA
jgi:Anaphase-promoting complex subunit 5